MSRSASAQPAADLGFLLSALALTGIVLLWLLAIVPIGLWALVRTVWEPSGNAPDEAPTD